MNSSLKEAAIRARKFMDTSSHFRNAMTEKTPNAQFVTDCDSWLTRERELWKRVLDQQMPEPLKARLAGIARVAGIIQ